MLRIGTGIDFHRFNVKRKLFLGGLKISDKNGLEGHSDADVIIHSICDALLGAISEGDIGTLFPDSDNRWKNKESSYFLKEILKKIRKRNYEILNLDITVISEKPKISKFRKDIIKSLSEIMEIDENKISLKATTTEQMGFIGREEGMCSLTSVLLINKKIEKFLEDKK